MSDIKKEMEELIGSYRSRLIDRLSAIDSIRLQLLKKWEPIAANDLALECHKLAGSAGTYGFHSISFKAKKLEDFLYYITTPDSGLLSKFSDLVDRLVYTPIKTGSIPLAIPVTKAQNLYTPLAENPIYIVDDDVEFVNKIAEDLLNYGYKTKLFSNLPAVHTAIDDEFPGALIIDQEFPEGRLAGAEFMKKIYNDNPRKIPTIFCSRHDDFESRYQAVQAGSDVYITKPYHISELVQHLDIMVAKTNGSKYKVLAIDDDEEILNLISEILNQADIEVSTSTKPNDVLNNLIKFDPDLILLDMHMPLYNGLEIASVISQHKHFVDTPIIFLTAEKNEDILLQARQNGVDDFIFKPIVPSNLISVCVEKAQRARSLNARLLKDNMTGLLNKSAFEHELQVKHKQSTRSESQLFLCILDLDNFKAVNDNYGHLTGDNVITSIASFMNLRLRANDIKGRIGGEEFAIILSDVNKEGALDVMNKLRVDFANILHSCEKEDFSVTISIGICSFRDTESEKNVYECADKALYKAKALGRNNVVVYEKQLPV